MTGTAFPLREGRPLPPRLATCRVLVALDVIANGTNMISIMKGIRVDPGDPTLLHEQVAAEIRRAIAEGEATPGERLPPARDLATVLGVNANTVLRSLRQLRDEGLVEFRRGHGITVSGHAQARSVVIARARDLMQFARRHGYQRDELIQIIEGLR
jgi:GntR family transcriptional regulator